MLNKRQMIVLDSTEMPAEIRKAVHERGEHWISNGSAVFFDVPTIEDVAEYSYDSGYEEIISKYLVSEGIEPGTTVLIHYWW